MYRSLYNLDSKPFAITPDPDFFWLGEKHKEALSVLKYGILENKGVLLLTGEAGIGKTIVVDALVRSLDQNIKWAVVEDPALERIDFYNAIAHGFGIEKHFTSKVQFLIRFSHYLHKMADEGQKVLLLIDDCHLLRQDMLEELRLLSNIEKEDAKLINIFFIGQPVFYSMLVLPKNRAIRQRLSLRTEIAPLNAGEVAEYISHRLKTAGSETTIFTAKAVKAIAKCSRGIPRWINIICDHALVTGSVQGKSVVDHKIIEYCVQKQDLSANFEDTSTSLIAPARSSVVPSHHENNMRNSALIYAVPCVILFVLGAYVWSIWQRPDEATSTVRITPTPVVVDVVQNASSLEKVIEPPVSAVEADESVENIAESHDVTEFAETVGETEAKDTEKLVAVPPGSIALPVVDIHPLSIEMPPEEVKVVQIAPLEPKKIILALRPDSLQLTGAATKDFETFITKLVEYPSATLLIKGFVSSKSNSPENIKLSEDRAKSVQNLLVTRGINAEQIQLQGMGNLEPLASNATSAGRRKNRRVEIIVLDDGR